MMWKDGWEENLEKAVRAIKALDKASYITLTIDAVGNLNVLAYPNDDEAEKRQLVAGLTHLTGKLEKRVTGSDIELIGEKDGINVKICAYDECEIVGYFEEEIPETITTGNMIKQKRMVSDCEIKQGKFAGKSIVING